MNRYNSDGESSSARDIDTEMVGGNHMSLEKTWNGDSKTFTQLSSPLTNI